MSDDQLLKEACDKNCNINNDNTLKDTKTPGEPFKQNESADILEIPNQANPCLHEASVKSLEKKLENLLNSESTLIKSLKKSNKRLLSLSTILTISLFLNIILIYSNFVLKTETFTKQSENPQTNPNDIITFNEPLNIPVNTPDKICTIDEFFNTCSSITDFCTIFNSYDDTESKLKLLVDEHY